MAQAIHRLSDEVEVLGLVALDHPLIRHAVARAAARGVRVFTLLSDLSVPQRSGYIGLDNQKAGRTAAWFIERLCRGMVKLALSLAIIVLPVRKAVRSASLLPARTGHGAADP
jgi:LacI family transcriptional regulator